MSNLGSVSITSDEDYLKIIFNEQALVSTTVGGLSDPDALFPANPNQGFGSAGFTIINHLLGSVPMVRVFVDPLKDGTWYNTLAGTPTGVGGDVSIDPWLTVLSNTTRVKILLSSNSASKTNIPVFYRIYDLGAKAITSDYSIDKIFKKDTASGVVAAASGGSAFPEQTTIPLPHPAGEAPLWKLQFSEDNSTWYDEGQQIIGPFDTSSGPPGGPYARYYYTRAYGYVNSSNFYIRLESNYATSKTLYARYSLDYRQ